MALVTFKQRYKPEKAASKDITRASLRRVIILDEKRIAATDGQKLVIIPAKVERATGEDWQGLHIDVEDLETRRAECKQLMDVGVQTRASTIASPHVDHIVSATKSSPVYTEISLNVKLLAEIAQAIDAENRVTLRIRGNEEGIEVWAHTREDGSEAFGILAPLKAKKRRPARSNKESK